MKLYTSFGPNPSIVTAFLAEKHQSLDTETLDITKAESRQPAFVRKNPAGTVPLLELDDGTCIAESLAICEYLDEVMPGPLCLIGSTPVERAITRMWLRRIDIGFVQPASSGWRFSEGLEFCKHFMPVIPRAANDFKAIAAQGVRWIDAQMGSDKYICGTRITLADILLYVFIEFGHVNGQPRDASLKWISSWRATLGEHPFVKVLQFKLPI